MTRNIFTVELEFDQAEEVSRGYLINLLSDINAHPFDSELIEPLNRLIAYMSTPGTWEDGKYDDYS